MRAVRRSFCVAELRQRLGGLVQRGKTGTNCCYAKQDEFWVNDPDGAEWEVYYFHPDAAFNAPRYKHEYDQTRTSQCCIAPAAQETPTELLTTAPMAFALADTGAEYGPGCSPGGVCC